MVIFVMMILKQLVRTARSSAHLHVFRDHDRGGDDDGDDDDAKLHTSGFKPPMVKNRWCGIDVADGTIT